MDATERETSLHAFRGEYGRLCTIAARALSHGHFDRAAVLKASQGKGQWSSPELTALKAQRLCVDMTISTAALRGNDRKSIVDAGLEAKRAVEGEWDVRIPIAG